MKSFYYKEPYRILFPLGILYLLCGLLIWVPQIWSPDFYPISLHRFLVLNGFTGSFIAGFLMTAVPKFSKTYEANLSEVLSYIVVTAIGIVLAHFDYEYGTYLVSAVQVFLILIFLFSRIFKRQENPPYSFVFIFVGLFLWLLSAFGSILVDNEAFKRLHYEGAIVAIILGVGSRLIPGILGHVEIVSAQREKYEKPVAILKTVPKHFFLLILAYIVSYFIPEVLGSYVRAGIVNFIALFYWRLYELPKNRSALTFSIWTSAWLIVLSFLLRAFWDEGGIHAAHSFFINGIVLLSLLIATRVLQSHGPKDSHLENWKGLYVITFLIFLTSATRVSAYLMPETYLHHLGYSSSLLIFAIGIWSWKYLRYIRVP